MTALPQPDAPGVAVRCHATVDTAFTETDGGAFRFSAPISYYIDVHEDGTIRLGAALADGDHAVITFRLVADGGKSPSFAGIRLGRSEDALGPLTLDTGGGTYGSLPFQVASSANPEGAIDTLVLTEIGDPAEVDSTFFYALAVDHDGNRYTDDPKIYNKGDGGGGGR